MTLKLTKPKRENKPKISYAELDGDDEDFLEEEVLDEEDHDDDQGQAMDETMDEDMNE